MKKLLLMIFFPFALAAQTGQSYLAICHKTWPCNASIKAYKEVTSPAPALAALLGPTFAETGNCPCLRKFLNIKKPKVLNFKIANGPCLRNRNCGPYEIFSGYSIESARAAIRANDTKLRARFQQAAEKIAIMLRGSEKLSCFYSSVLEHDFSPEEIQIVNSWVAGYFPSCQLVNNPVGVNKQGTSRVPGLFQELHGQSPKLEPPCIVDLDGEDMNTIDIKKYLERFPSCQRYLWGLKYNCKNSHDKSFIDPRKRVCTATSAYFAEAARYMKPIKIDESRLDDKDLAGCKAKNKAEDGEKKGFIWKQSDTHQGAVILFPAKFKRFSKVVTKKNGKVLDSFKFAYLYQDNSGRQVWRGSKAPRDYPSNVVLKADGQCFVLKRPQFRID